MARERYKPLTMESCLFAKRAGATSHAWRNYVLKWNPC